MGARLEGNENEIIIMIDGKEINAIEGESILQVAKKVGINIPTLCYNDALESFGACRMCSVEITDNRGRKKIVTSCNYPVVNGLVVETKSEKVFKTRQMLLELLLARCPNAKKIQDLARKYGIEKPSLWIVDPEEDCILCGLCTRVCDEKVGVSAINFANRGVKREVTTPYHTISDDCVGCGACAMVCPTDSSKVRKTTYPMLEEDIREAEKQFLNGTRDEFLGVYSEILAAKSPISGQDGGMATTLLLSGFEKGLFDSAIVVKRTVGYKAEAFIVESAEEILSAKGTKYSRVKMMSKIGELVEEGKSKIAFVGTPCEIRTGRKIQQQLLSKYPDLKIIIVGLFCFEAFEYKKLKEATQQLLGVDLDKAEETRINKGNFIVNVDGTEFSAKVKDFHGAIQGGCLYCNDFTGRIADVSVGSVGSREGYSTVIVRSDVGKNLFLNVDCTTEGVNIEDVVKLAKLKKKRANEKFSPIIEGAKNYKEM